MGGRGKHITVTCRDCGAVRVKRPIDLKDWGGRCIDCCRRARATPRTELPAEKRCSRCGQVKGAAEFSRKKGKGDGLNTYCIPCNRDYQREWARTQRKSKPEFVERQRKRSREHMRRRMSDPANKERKRIREREQRNSWRDDPVRWEAVQSRRQAHYAAQLNDPEQLAKIKARRLEYYLRVRSTEAYKLTALLAAENRRNRKLNATSDPFTKADWEGVLFLYEGCCAYCGVSGRLEQEHVIPLSRGGIHAASNIVPACRSCNGRKGARTPEEAGMALRPIG